MDRRIRSKHLRVSANTDYPRWNFFANYEKYNQRRFDNGD
jgi:hypothetical protein